MRLRLLASVCALGLLAAGASTSFAAEPVARVVSASGAAFAQSPGEPARPLACRDPLFAGDRVFTRDGSSLGLDADGWYGRLDENSEIVLGTRGEGGPSFDLRNGHLRVLDAGAASQASVSTPDLVAQRSGPDVEALVFGEKAGVVSMVCAYDEPVSLARRSGPERLVAAPGGCAIAKPREPLYAAEASHPRLAALPPDVCQDLAATPVAGAFSPGSVSLGPELLGGGPQPADAQPETLSPLGIFEATPPNAATPPPPPPPPPPGLPTPFPFIPPVPSNP